MNGVKSTNAVVTHGVPQGSILGPLLFLLFINDFPASSGKFTFNLFADDSTLSYSFESNDATVGGVVNDELVLVNRWLCSNKIKINADKTNYIIFSLRNAIAMPPVMIGNSEIFRTASTKFLGLHLDQHLKFDQHIASLSQKLSKSIGILYRLKFYMPSHVLKNLYFALIHPYLQYAIESWYGCSSYLQNRIFVLQKKSVRCIFNLPFNEHTSQYFNQANIMNLHQLYKYSVLIYFHKTIHANNNNINFSPHLIYHFNVHNFSTRFSNNFVIPRHRTSKYEKSLLYSGTKLWNQLPSELKQISSTIAFKNKLRFLLFSQP